MKKIKKLLLLAIAALSFLRLQAAAANNLKKT